MVTVRIVLVVPFAGMVVGLKAAAMVGGATKVN